ncbi:TetR/AcrR family transcriptional regulator [Cytobacillus sp. IB215665]|uniref:TetR/AcrR family transcriptional regulator n=1 Tax=Cytobacillus sp. IB215665 TaxID=3097357 RepID=UPI002A0E580F|nr:TetR/AcrR family transcriptional regulator [Cytobacillus sp. IB215665]MDX8366128.1 TetR/AcrR family transcriptional regulator [Cytobacillus sp. IB215665]
MKRGSKDVTPEKIIDVAKELFFRNGYKTTSLKEVADALNVTRPAIYHYFKSKDEIIFSIIDKVTWKITDFAKITLAREDIKDHEKFHLLVKQHILLILENKMDIGLFFDEKKNLSNDLINNSLQHIRLYYKHATELYKKAVASGDFVDIPPSIAVQTIFGSCNWAYQWYDANGHLSKEEIAEMMSSLLLNGYRSK